MNAGLIWLIVAAILGGAELAVPGVFLVFLAIAAALTGIALLALPALPVIAQLVSFTIWSGLAIAIGKRWYSDYPVATADPLLNDRAARLIGEIVIVVEPVSAGEGRVRVGDGIWSARGPDAAIGARMRVAGVRDGILRVEAMPTLP